MRKASSTGDIKPANIMLTEKGQAKIIDFGLAKLSSGVDVTKTLTVMGTIAYMSPEQAKGEAVDHRTDIWSLGATLYEMLTGQMPFGRKQDQALIYSILNDTAEPVSRLRPEIPNYLERAVQKALQKNKFRRYQNMGELLKDLKATQVSGFSLPKAEKSIIVLPFENISPDPEQEHFCDGMTEEIITDLSHVHDLLVIRIAAQLIDSSTDAHLWAEKYTGTLDDVFDIQEKVSRSIVDALKVTLSAEEKRKIAERPIDNIAAYEWYMRATGVINMYNTEEGIYEALRYFEHAISTIGDNALIYSGMAYAHFLLMNINVKMELNHKEAEKFVHKALALDSGMSKARALLGYLNIWYRGKEVNQKEGVRQFKMVLTADPSEPMALLGLLFVHLWAGRRSAAIPLMERYRQVEPVGWANYLPGAFHFYDGQYELVSRLINTFPKSCAKTGHFHGGVKPPLGASLRSADPLRGTTPSPSNSPAVARLW